MSHRNQPPSRRALPPSRRALPPSRRALPPSRRALLLSRRALPLSRRALPLCRRAHPLLTALLPLAALVATGCDDMLGGGPRLVVSGRVLLAADRTPVAGARLVASTNRTGEWQQHQRAVAYSGADGRYSLSLDCPRGAQLYVLVAYEAGRSVLGEPGRDDLVIHGAEHDGRPLDNGVFEERITCSETRWETVDFLLRTPVRGPAEVAGDHRFAQLSAGSYTICGVTPAGAAHCWGNGALGDGGYRPYGQPGSAPVAVSGGLVFATVAAGSDVACGITTAGTAYCWGGYHTAAAGDGAPAGTPRLVPQRVASDLQFRTIAAGDNHACAVAVSGSAYCWGGNTQGELGAGTTGPPAAQPRLVAGGLHFEAIVAGRNHSCALTAAGAAYCWGNGHVLGAQLTQPTAVPVPVAGGHTFTTLSAGAAHTCGLTPAGAAWCWGGNSAGQLGSGAAATLSPVPVRVAGDHVFSAISTGFEHSCATTADGRAYCWGNNDATQLGVAQPRQSSVPVAVATALRFTTVAAGHGGPTSGFTCALDVQGRAYCWGANTAVLGTGP
jgi:alpha-tubulin suppressor-like RCC1 family protein